MKSFDVPTFYRSELISKVKAKRKADDPRKKDFTPSLLHFGSLEFILARHFGFCYGVENAIERAYKALNENPGKRIFLLSQMIHNPMVNQDLEDNGISFIMDTNGNQLIDWDEITTQDVVLIPAFGTTREIEELLKEKQIDVQTYNTTCPFVEKVWNRSAKLSDTDHTIIIHGKPTHEETRATFSHAAEHGPALVVKDLNEAKQLGDYILGKSSEEVFQQLFGNRTSTNFSPTHDLTKIGVVNQTTMLASDTQEITDYLREVMIEKYGEDNIKNHIADTRDTLCYATNDNQSATFELLNQEADLAIVVGGYNSSNTSHIVELCERKFPTYFIKSAEEILSNTLIQHFDYPHKKLVQTTDFLPNKTNLKIVITSGASCPDALLDQVMEKLLSYYPNSKTIEEVVATL